MFCEWYKQKFNVGVYVELSPSQSFVPLYFPPSSVKNVVLPLFFQPVFPAFIDNPYTEFAFSSLVSIEGISLGSTNDIPFASPAENPVSANFVLGSENPCNNNSYVPSVAYFDAVKLISNTVTSIFSPTSQI